MGNPYEKLGLRLDHLDLSGNIMLSREMKMRSWESESSAVFLQEAILSLIHVLLIGCCMVQCIVGGIILHVLIFFGINKVSLCFYLGHLRTLRKSELKL